jgi:hypothetical protein
MKKMTFKEVPQVIGLTTIIILAFIIGAIIWMSGYTGM